MGDHILRRSPNKPNPIHYPNPACVLLLAPNDRTLSGDSGPPFHDRRVFNNSAARAIPSRGCSHWGKCVSAAVPTRDPLHHRPVPRRCVRRPGRPNPNASRQATTTLSGRPDCRCAHSRSITKSCNATSRHRRRFSLLRRPRFSWTRIKGESDVQGGWENGSVEEHEWTWVGTDEGSPEGDWSRCRRRGRGRRLGPGAAVERAVSTTLRQPDSAFTVATPRW